jgi:hypothetical protein
MAERVEMEVQVLEPLTEVLVLSAVLEVQEVFAHTADLLVIICRQLDQYKQVHIQIYIFL